MESVRANSRWEMEGRGEDIAEEVDKGLEIDMELWQMKGRND